MYLDIHIIVTSQSCRVIIPGAALFFKDFALFGFYGGSCGGGGGGQCLDALQRSAQHIPSNTRLLLS